MKDFMSLVESETADMTMTADQKKIVESMKETGWSVSSKTEEHLVIENASGNKFEVTVDGKLKEWEA